MKVRVTVEFHVDEMACNDEGITKEQLLRSIEVAPDDGIDGCQIFPNQPIYDLSNTFLLSDFHMVSKEIVE